MGNKLSANLSVSYPQVLRIIGNKGGENGSKHNFFPRKTKITIFVGKT
jgi:hypothetical protein